MSEMKSQPHTPGPSASLGRKGSSSAYENPKHKVGMGKPSLSYIPPAALILEGQVFRSGAEKYGPFNWADAGVVSSIYYDAIMRHLLAWYTGQDKDPESGVSHLAHIRACCGILIDCQMLGNMHDDRPLETTEAALALRQMAELIQFPTQPRETPEF